MAVAEAPATHHTVVPAHIPAAAEAAEAADFDNQAVGTHRALEIYKVVPVDRVVPWAIVSPVQRTLEHYEGVGKAAKVRLQVAGIGTTNGYYAVLLERNVGRRRHTRNWHKG